ncbi:uncharacterized protein LOC113360740 [Papaver somniferum]|uniref:uncharacterized protein LOC113360740 n=1 Tax=Papaver somniferum TaxID=3469 RepID=UPI000E70011B|nr:uncharacterized protein LOC113360740 [Papaver somniferum]
MNTEHRTTPLDPEEEGEKVSDFNDLICFHRVSYQSRQGEDEGKGFKEEAEGNPLREKEKGLQFALELLYGKNSSKVEFVMKLVKLDFKILFEEYKDAYSVHEEESSSSIQRQAKAVVSKPVTGPSRLVGFCSNEKVLGSVEK